MNEKSARALRRRTIATVIVLCVLVFVIYLFIDNAVKLYDLEQRKIQLAEDIENEASRSKQLDEEVQQMGSKSYVEYCARKYLGLYYPDEIIVIPVEGESLEQPINTTTTVPATEPATEPTETADPTTDQTTTEEQFSTE